MKSGPFISLISRAYRVEESSVRVYARLLKEAGLLTTGPGGRGAPHMQPLDAARLTIALLATDSPARAVERVQEFGQLPFVPEHSKFEDDPYWTSIEPYFLEGENVVLESALAALFASEPDGRGLGDLIPALEIRENSKSATILWRGGEAAFNYDLPANEEEAVKRRVEHGNGIRRTRAAFLLELTKVWLAMWLDRNVPDDELHPSVERAKEYVREMDPTWQWGAS